MHCKGLTRQDMSRGATPAALPCATLVPGMDTWEQYGGDSERGVDTALGDVAPGAE